MAAAIVGGGGWTRLRAVGHGASGAVVSLAEDDATGELFVVKSAVQGAAAARQLRREWGVMAGLSSPHVLKCLGFFSEAGRDGGEDRLFLEYAPGGSLADVMKRHGSGLDEGAVGAYAADVVRGLEYLHGKLVVHGDVKASNVLVGADGHAKLADFGCARAPSDSRRRVLGGTPAFMAPEVARGDEQVPAADVWALGCTVIEMATGRAPWSDVATDNVAAALWRIACTDAVPNVPSWLSPEAKDFLSQCLQQRAGDRATAVQLLHHPFVVAAMPSKLNNGDGFVKATWVSPTSALDAAYWESETDIDEDDDMSSSPAGRISAMASGALPDWCSDDGWIELGKGRVSISVADIAQECDESSESPAARIRALACPPSSVPDWDSDHQGWIELRSATSADDNGGVF